MHLRGGRAAALISSSTDGGGGDTQEATEANVKQLTQHQQLGS